MNHSDNYKNSIIDLFNYKKIEIIDFYDSNLNIIHKKYDDKNEKYSILKTYTTFEKSSDSVNLIPTTILGLHGLDFSKTFYLKKYYFDQKIENIDTHVQEYEAYIRDKNPLDEIITNFNIDNYLNNNVFINYDFDSIDIYKRNKDGNILSSIPENETNEYKKLKNTNIITYKKGTPKTQHEIIPLSNNINQEFGNERLILSKTTTYFIELPTYYKINLSAQDIDFTNNINYQTIHLPLINIEEGTFTTTLIPYNIKYNSSSKWNTFYLYY